MQFTRYFWKSQFWAQNLTFWPLEGMGKSFPEDNIYIVWNALLSSNLMQKIKKFWRAVRKQSLKSPILDQIWPFDPARLCTEHNRFYIRHCVPHLFQRLKPLLEPSNKSVVFPKSVCLLFGSLHETSYHPITITIQECVHQKIQKNYGSLWLFFGYRLLIMIG